MGINRMGLSIRAFSFSSDLALCTEAEKAAYLDGNPQEIFLAEKVEKSLKRIEKQLNEQMMYYAKDDTNASVFQSDSGAKLEKVTSQIREIVDQNLWPFFERFETSSRNFRKLRQHLDKNLI